MKLLSVVAGIVLLASFACRAPRAEMKVEEWQRTQAESAATRLREVFNTAACQPIYNAAAEYFRIGQDPREWSVECEQLKQQLGSWQSFEVTQTQRWLMPGMVVSVRGSAGFERGKRQIDVAWLLTRTGPQLFWIAIQQDEQHWKQIPKRPLLHRLMDPIPINVIKNG